MKCTGYVPLVKLPKNSFPLKVYFAIGIGGVIGTSLRYLISLTFDLVHFGTFPWATFFVNITGAFLLTFILFHPALKKKIKPTILTALTVGLIGSYTTFSAITIEVVTVWQDDVFVASIYLFLTIVGGLLFSFAGYKAACRLEKAGTLK